MGNTSFWPPDVDEFAPIIVLQGTVPWVVTGTITTSPDVNIHDSAGGNLNSTAGALNSFITNFPSSFIVNQGTSPWTVDGTVTANIGTTGGLALDSSLTTINTTLGSPFQAGGSIGNTSFGASQDGVWSVGRTWDLNFATDQVDASGSSVSISNFPATVAVTQSTTPWIVNGSGFTQPISGTVTALQGTSPWVVSGSVTVSGTITANQGTSPWIVDGSGFIQPVSQSGTWTTGRTWDLNFATDQVDASGSSVSISNFPATVAVTQSTSPWVISGTVTANAGTNLNTSALNLEATQSAFKSANHSDLLAINTTLGSPFQAGGSIGNTSFGATQVTSPWVVSGSVSVSNFPAIQPVSQSGTWTTGRTWTLASGTDSVTSIQGTSPWVVSGTVAATQSGTWTVQPGNTANTTAWLVTGTGGTFPVTDSGGSLTVDNNGTFAVQAAQSGTWNINNISGTISLPTGAATEATLAKLTQTQGSTTSGQSGPLVQGAVTTAAPSYTTAQTSPLSLTTSGGLRTDTSTIAGTTVVTAGVAGLQAIGGNAASATTDSGNPVKIGSIVNTTLPTFTAGQRADAQSDVNGRIYVNAVPLDGSKTTYRAASAAAFASAALATDIATLTGSASKTIRVLRIRITATQTTASEVNMFILKRSTANSGGTSTALTAVPLDSANAAATATALQYTANPTTGTLVGNIDSFKMDIPPAAVGGNATTTDPLEVTFGELPGQALVLRGTSQVLAINLGGVTIAGSSFLVMFEWTEEA